jgi:hypothetical protein
MALRRLEFRSRALAGWAVGSRRSRRVGGAAGSFLAPEAALIPGRELRSVAESGSDGTEMAGNPGFRYAPIQARFLRQVKRGLRPCSGFATATTLEADPLVVDVDKHLALACL